MKKFIVLLTALCFAVFGFTACSSDGKNNNAENGEKFSVVATVFPAYDWVKQIMSGSDDIDLTLLFDDSADLHNYQPTADDIIKITNCDMFIYVGGESDEWVEDVLKQSANENMIAVNLLDAIGENAKTEEHKEGMEEEHSECEEEAEYDEHVWLSLKNAQILCSYIGEKLSSLDSENADLFSKNTESYISSLKALDEKYQSVVDNAENKTLVFADRFPFRYMTDDYPIDYYAAFAGCSAESEASFETVSFLAKKVDELNLKYVMTIEGANHNIAQTVIDNTSKKNQQILVLDSMQSKTLDDIKNGETYLSVMENNLTVLQQVFG